MDNPLLIVILILSIVSTIVICALLILLALQNKRITSKNLSAVSNMLGEYERRMHAKINDARTENARDLDQLRSSLSESLTLRIDYIGRSLGDRSDSMNESIAKRQEMLQSSVNDNLAGVRTSISSGNLQSEERFKSFESALNEQLRTLDASLRSIRETTETQLDAIRGIVNEKLQQALNERLSESFKIVDERLAEVHKGLGEMQTLASGVGDLKKVLSNVKTRGILGEIQLRSILDEILSPEQFTVNFDPGKGTKERVEFAVKLPNSSDKPVYLPIDSKFPYDKYAALVDAYDSGDASSVSAAQKELRTSLFGFAKDIQTKYINPPLTTSFAIMFLPTEGLYSEAVRLGMIEELQSKHKVNIAGPSTMAALLNSFQMGFRTLAIQKQSGEVWELLGQIKKEFGNFDKALSNAKKSLDDANSSLDDLIGKRTRAIIGKLNKIEELPQPGVSKPELIQGETPADDS